MLHAILGRFFTSIMDTHTHTQRNIMNNVVRCVRKNVTCTVISYMSSYMDFP